MAKSCSAGQVASHGFPGLVYSYSTLGSTEGFQRHRELYIPSEAHPSSLSFDVGTPLMHTINYLYHWYNKYTPTCVSVGFLSPSAKTRIFKEKTFCRRGQEEDETQPARARGTLWTSSRSGDTPPRTRWPDELVNFHFPSLSFASLPW